MGARQIGWAALVLVGCNGLHPKHLAVDALMQSAYEPPRVAGQVAQGGRTLQLLSGDFHCHVTPPDGPPHVVRGFEETVRLAESAGLDFVILTPHLRARFFDSGLGAEVLREQRALQAQIEALPNDEVVWVPGFEYTDFEHGHAGMAFGDLEEALNGPASKPFFERYVDTGGVLIINHPILTPVKSWFAVASWDLSWRALVAPGDQPPEIMEIDQSAQAFEAFNLAIAELRDRFLLGDDEASIREVFARFDQKILKERRRIAPVGGSDSHGHHLVASTFVLSESKTPAGIRDAVLKGRTCVRSPEACTFTARANGGPAVLVGGALEATDYLEARARGGDVELFVNGKTAARTRSQVPVRVPLPPSECAVVRARVGKSWSGPIYVGCDFAR